MISRQREWQKKQAKMGNCIICGKPATAKKYVPGKALFCEDHRNEKRVIQMAYYERKKANGICYTCDSPALPGRIKCKECAENYARYQRERRIV